MKKYILNTYLLLFLTYGLNASETTWLSGTPPKDFTGKITPIGMQKLSGLKGNRGKEVLVLWLREGTSPLESKYLDHSLSEDAQFFVFSPSGELINHDLLKEDNSLAITYDGSMEGFYNIYMLEKFVKNDTLYIQIAKAERLSHKCRNGHKGIIQKMPPQFFNDKIPFEIIRERIPREDFHTFLSCGDELTFKAMLNGIGVENANILITTQKQWGKTLKTNVDGEINLQLISDYFSNLRELQKKKIHRLLLKANYTLAEEGLYKEIPYKYIQYTCTFPEDYIPSEMVYKSRVWGVFVLVFGIAVLSIMIYIHRTRKAKKISK